MKGYKESLEECFSRARARGFECDRKCSQYSSRNDWPREKLLDCFNECIKAYDNSGCIKVSEHHDCHRWCEATYSSNNPLVLIERSVCKAGCNSTYGAPEHHSQESTPLVISDILKDIENNSYDFADSVSVL